MGNLNNTFNHHTHHHHHQINPSINGRLRKLRMHLCQLQLCSWRLLLQQVNLSLRTRPDLNYTSTTLHHHGDSRKDGSLARSSGRTGSEGMEADMANKGMAWMVTLMM